LSDADSANIAAGNGIAATDSSATITPEQHVSGVKPSQFISTTKNPAVANEYSGSGNGVAVIDSEGVPNQIDISGGSPDVPLDL